MGAVIYFKTMKDSRATPRRDRDRVAARARVSPIARAARLTHRRARLDRPTDDATRRDSTRFPGENAEGEGTRRTRLGRPGVDAAFTLSRTRVER